ncbi:MAG: hypothetical protein UY56_C0001G0015 [Parcubacteria group bacterium GW2011_GWA1_50_14]|nr:MAG: hypothetical protein UY56_C0001G0015 [Parcubacteria group bacterium GW2011_GWA1_50_14]
MREIVDLDSGSAATIFSFIKIPRDNPREELGMIELENSLSQAIWKMFDGIRVSVSERLGVDEADILLTDARVIGVKIDGNQIINPSGFTGRELEILLALTMVKRDKFIEGKELFEGGSVRAYLIAKETGFEDSIYVEVGDNSTTIFEVTPHGVSYVNNFDWGVAKLTDSIREEFGVEQTTAQGMYKRHAGGEVSEHVRKKMDKIFYDTLAEFINGVIIGIKSARNTKNDLPPIYLHTFFPIPEGLHRKRFSFGNKRMRFLPSAAGSDIEVFASDEVHNRYDELNQLARRRIKWLMPTA